jgi:hypothetical protein
MRAESGALADDFVNRCRYEVACHGSCGRVLAFGRHTSLLVARLHRIRLVSARWRVAARARFHRSIRIPHRAFDGLPGSGLLRAASSEEADPTMVYRSHLPSEYAPADESGLPHGIAPHGIARTGAIIARPTEVVAHPAFRSVSEHQGDCRSRRDVCDQCPPVKNSAGGGGAKLLLV